MKIFYLPKTPFGEFFYNPESSEGVGVHEGRPSVVGMSQDYDPKNHPGCREFEVDGSVFIQLRDAALKCNSAASDLQKALGNFPRVPIVSRPQPDFDF